jgi:hypothetical protein
MVQGSTRRLLQDMDSGEYGDDMEMYGYGGMASYGYGGYGYGYGNMAKYGYGYMASYGYGDTAGYGYGSYAASAGASTSEANSMVLFSTAYLVMSMLIHRNSMRIHRKRILTHLHPDTLHSESMV